MLGHLGYGLGEHIAAGTAGDVVEDAGLVDGIGHGYRAGDHALLGGLVVVGSHQQHGIRAHGGGVAGELHRVGGIVGACARDDGNAVIDPLHAVLDGGAMLVVGEGRALARGANGHDGVDALLDLPVDHGAVAVKVDAIGGQGGDDGGGGAGEYGGFVHGFVPFCSVYFKCSRFAYPQSYALTHRKSPHGGSGRIYGYPPKSSQGDRVWIALRVSATARRMFSAEPVKCLAKASASAPTPFPHGFGNLADVR